MIKSYNSYTEEEGDTKYFFVEGIGFNTLCERLAKNYKPANTIYKSGVYTIEDISLIPINNKNYMTILIKGYKKGLEKTLEKELNCTLK